MLIDFAELYSLPTLHVGHDSDLKIETFDTRVWLSRMTIADGETEPIQLEELEEGRWKKFEYPDRPGVGSIYEYPIFFKGEWHRIRLLKRWFTEKIG